MFYRSPTEDHSQRPRRARAVIAMACVAFAIGAIVGADHTSSSTRALAQSYVSSWTRGEYARMYSELDASSRQATSLSAFSAAYRAALSTATATSLRLAGMARGAAGGEIVVPVRVHT